MRPITTRRIPERIVRFGLEQARRFYTHPKSEKQVEEIIRTCDIDLVAISSGAITTGVRAARRTGVPFVWHLREFMQEDHGLTYYPWAHAYEHMKDAAALICVSQAVAEKMRGICPDARFEVVYNGIDQEVFHPAEEARSAGGPARLMYSGGIKHSKGAFLILDALAELDPSLSYELDVFGEEGRGDGENEQGYLAYAHKLGLPDVVRYHGMVKGMADQYRSHDVAIVASRKEAFGRVTAEAMLCGCAVVGSNAGGTPELIAGERGYLFEPGDAGSLAEQLTRALSDPAERATRVSRALSYARENFSVNAYVDGIEAVYSSVVA